VAGNCVHDASPSNSLGSDGESCSQQQECDHQPPPRRRSSFGDAPEAPMPSWEIDTDEITCVCTMLPPRALLLMFTQSILEF